jgi:WD40 repeat protein
MERAVAMMAANKIVLILIMIEETHSPLHQIATLGCQTVSSARLPDGRMGYGMSNHSVQLLDLTRSTVETLKTNHTKRLNKFDVHGDTLATSSNDGSVRLYDLRTFKQTMMLKSNQISDRRKPGRVLFGDSGR